MASNLLSRGDVFAGRYKIERAIGAGGMGAVFEAEHLETERRVALKVLLPHSLVSDTARERFKLEARVAGKIRHPHIVDVLDAGVDDITGMPYLVMELLEGEDLGTRVDRLGPMTPEEAVALLAQVASALDCLHERSIVHRDLKPENLFLTWGDDGARAVKLLDFGVAKVIQDGNTSALTQDAQGTPVYMAPEQFAEQIRISAATDIYALGMVAYALLTGKHYWGPEIERGMNVFMLARIAEGGPREPASKRAGRHGASLPAAFDEWFSIITSIEPGHRYPTAGDAVEVLADVLGVTPGAPAPSSRRLRTLPGPPPDPPKAPPPEKSAIASTPPMPLRRPVPLWRRPTTMTAGLLGVACLMAYLLLLAPRLGSDPPQGDAPEPPAASASAPVLEPDPTAAAPASLPSAAPAHATPTASASVLAASSASAPEPPLASASASAPVAAPTSGAVPEADPSAPGPPTGSAARPRPTPRAPAPVTTKRPKYTRE